MISNFKISKFRHFDEVELKNLKRVNLFVGKNSAGKSALLEALLFFFTQMSPANLPVITDSRQENWDMRTNSGKSTLRHLFSNHILPGYGERGFRLESKGDPRSFEVRVNPYLVEQEGITSAFTPVGLSKLAEMDLELVEPFLVVDKSGQTSRLIRLSRYGDPRRRYGPRVDGKPQAFFVPTRGITDEETALLWDSVSLTDSEFEVVKGLQLIEPAVEGVAFVGSDNNSRVALVKIAGYSEPVSLKSLGDGMSRVLQIILSLVNAQDSVLLIDEFENGLHWGVQRDVWSLVFRLAKRLNVQVFASTHSRDCIYGFAGAWKEDVGSGAFARIEKVRSKVSINEYSLDLLSDSLETDVEVR